MADLNNHYERAFASYLRSRRVLTIPVEESRRTFMEGRPIKSLDFIVQPVGGPTLLVDVKGRRLSAERATLQNWATEDDVLGLLRWQRGFANSRGVLVFAYQLPSEQNLADFPSHHSHADRHYGYLAVGLADFLAAMRVRSASWKTYSLRQADFRRLARPFAEWLEASPLWELPASVGDFAFPASPEVAPPAPPDGDAAPPPNVDDPAGDAAPAGAT